MDPVTGDQLRKELRDVFGGALRAVSDIQDFDFIVIWQVLPLDDEGGAWLALFPSETKEFRLYITEVEDQGDEWIVTTPEQVWSFRQVPDSVDKERFIKNMREAGIG